MLIFFVRFDQISSCWNEDPEDRPGFIELEQYFRTLLVQEGKDNASDTISDTTTEYGDYTTVWDGIDTWIKYKATILCIIFLLTEQVHCNIIE